ncbi:MAG: family 4 glycosyl hydrolase, partial [Armatimonadota bacterium]
MDLSRRGRRKIVLVGAGSASFTQGLVADLILASDLGPWSLGLVDISQEALDVAAGLVARMLAARPEADIEVQADTDRRRVLPGADVVVTTIAVGGRRSWELDVTIPRKYGAFQPVGDTIMPGGLSRALRMVPAMVEIARDVVELCPDALFVNYSNPLTIICRAVRKATGAPVVGLCHGVMSIEQYLADFAGIPRDEVTSLAVGVNHLTFFLELRWKGHDAWCIVRARIAEERGESVDHAALRDAFPELDWRRRQHMRTSDTPFSWSLFEAYGAYPAVNDRHVVEFFPHRFPGGRYGGGTLGVDVFSVEQVIEHGEETYQRMKRIARGEEEVPEWLFRRAPGEHEQLLDIVRSIVRDERRVFSMNLPNQGAVPNLPSEAVLEIPACAAGRGPCPLLLGPVPSPLAAVLNRVIAVQELGVEAALRGSRQLFVEALLADGSVSDPDTAQKLADELIA